MSRSHIADFIVNDKHYSQGIDLTNDSVYLYDDEDQDLLELTSNCDVYELVPTRKQIGRFKLRDNHWIYADKAAGEETIGSSFELSEGLLDDEVKFSKKWLQAKVFT